jgi:hypothetical protein
LTEVSARPARFVVEELAAAGVEAHLGEPADTAAARGPKRRAKTDRLDARGRPRTTTEPPPPPNGERP